MSNKIGFRFIKLKIVGNIIFLFVNNMCLSRTLFVCFRSLHNTNQLQVENVLLVCIGFEPGAAGL